MMRPSPARHGRMLTRRNRPRACSRQAGFDLDLGPGQSPRDWTTLSRLLGEMLELRVVDSNGDHAYVEHDRSDCHLLADLLDGALRVGLYTDVLCAGLLEVAAERHRVARCLRCGEELFGIRCPTFAEPRG